MASLQQLEMFSIEVLTGWMPKDPAGSQRIFLRELQRLPRLQDLRLSLCQDPRLEDEDIEPLCSYPHLERLTLRQMGLGFTGTGLCNLCCIKSLKFLDVTKYESSDVAFNYSGYFELAARGATLSLTDIQKFKQLRPDVVIKHPSVLR